MADDVIFSMVPEDLTVSPEEAMAAAVASQMEASADIVPLSEPAAVPFGNSWQFDFELRRFVRAGTGPAQTQGFATLEQWCLMAIHSARYQHAAFSEDFGQENPNDPLGSFAVGEVVADWERELIDALMLHDRVVSVENVVLDWNPQTGVLTVVSLDVVTDEQNAGALSIRNVAIEGGVG